LPSRTQASHRHCDSPFDADYRFNLPFDAYLGAMYSGVHDGVASGYLNTTNINPTVGVRYRFEGVVGRRPRRANATARIPHLMDIVRSQTLQLRGV
jgi:hypothetical protein